VATVEPFQARMSPVVQPDGVVFIRDDVKAPLWSLSTSLDFMRCARATRKIAVIGTLSDFAGAERGYVQAARQALDAVDHAIFVGRWAPKALRARRDPHDDRVLAFQTVEQVSRHLDTFLRPGDLVLLKGSNTADHLVRIALARTSPVRCWRSDCRKLAFCNTCALLTVPARDSGAASAARSSTDTASAERSDVPSGPLAVVVGLGNPGDRYRDTPHNVGQRVLDEVARRLELPWVAGRTATIAEGSWRGLTLKLVKPAAFVNETGAVLARLADELVFTADECILVYDDLSLPLGSVRSRMQGSDGGHRGVRSILLSFGTEAVRRIKIGVGKDGDRGREVERVLSPFSPDEIPLVTRACAEAADRLLEMVLKAPDKAKA
jgi:aminoacyl-tRNA hydrolase